MRSKPPWLPINFREFHFRDCMKSLGCTGGVVLRTAKTPLLAHLAFIDRPGSRSRHRSNHFSYSLRRGVLRSSPITFLPKRSPQRICQGLLKIFVFPCLTRRFQPPPENLLS